MGRLMNNLAIVVYLDAGAGEAALASNRTF